VDDDDDDDGSCTSLNAVIEVYAYQMSLLSNWWLFVQTCEHTKRLIDADLVTPNDMYFIATLQRGTATMTVHVAVGHDYPTSTASLVLSIYCAGVMHTALNDEAVRVSDLYCPVARDLCHLL